MRESSRFCQDRATVIHAGIAVFRKFLIGSPANLWPGCRAVPRQQEASPCVPLAITFRTTLAAQKSQKTAEGRGHLQGVCHAKTCLLRAASMAQTGGEVLIKLSTFKREGWFLEQPPFPEQKQQRCPGEPAPEWCFHSKFLIGCRNFGF